MEGISLNWMRGCIYFKPLTIEHSKKILFNGMHVSLQKKKKQVPVHCCLLNGIIDACLTCVMRSL